MESDENYILFFFQNNRQFVVVIVRRVGIVLNFGLGGFFRNPPSTVFAAETLDLN